ncbi:MAG: TetR/AcrR family transcriptional regulator [Prevotella sp.]|nr:TetR/AcrR family transcriptional regulator [Prevotella sp.]
MKTNTKNFSTLYRVSLKEKILNTAMACFYRQGIKSVKMDDIAHQLSISKRTLYELYHNKQELLLACIKTRRERLSHQFEELVAHGANTMDIFIEILTNKIEEVNHIHSNFFTELDKYPMVMDYLEKTRKEQQARSLGFFKKGVNEGYFRADINFNIVMEINNSCVEHVLKSEMYNRYPLNEIHRTITIVFVRGLCTEKGVKCIDRTFGVEL